MAVSTDELSQVDLVLPRPEHPVVMANGKIDPIWYRFFVDLTRLSNDSKELVNAIRTEVNTQHP